MSLEQALQENTQAMRDLTAALKAGPTAVAEVAPAGKPATEKKTRAAKTTAAAPAAEVAPAASKTDDDDSFGLEDLGDDDGFGLDDTQAAPAVSTAKQQRTYTAAQAADTMKALRDVLVVEKGAAPATVLSQEMLKACGVANIKQVSEAEATKVVAIVRRLAHQHAVLENWIIRCKDAFKLEVV